MARKKSKKQRYEELEKKWSTYFQRGDLDDWQRLCGDLNLPNDLPSKTQCRAALTKININIVQFLNAQSRPEDVTFFRSKNELSSYCHSRNAFFPKRKIESGSPLRSLLKMFF